ncbi:MULTISPECIES: hypothetical protein [unclassified Mesorhizobium]|nr:MULTISPECIES: hypothetical protein [unclassified Mesorhizobium]
MKGTAVSAAARMKMGLLMRMDFMFASTTIGIAINEDAAGRLHPIGQG